MLSDWNEKLKELGSALRKVENELLSKHGPNYMVQRDRRFKGLHEKTWEIRLQIEKSKDPFLPVSRVKTSPTYIYLRMVDSAMAAKKEYHSENS